MLNTVCWLERGGVARCIRSKSSQVNDAKEEIFAIFRKCFQPFTDSSLMKIDHESHVISTTFVGGSGGEYWQCGQCGSLNFIVDARWSQGANSC